MFTIKDMTRQELKIIADGAILALANSAKFNETLNNKTNWTYRQFNDFILNKNKDNLIVFNTVWENEWMFQFLMNEESDQPYFRKFEQSIEVTGEELHLVSWTDLTSSLQFKNTPLPDKHHRDLKIKIDNGFYKVIVKQLSNPDHYEDMNDNPINFVVEMFLQSENPNIKANHIMWAEDFPNDDADFLNSQPNELDEFLSNLFIKK